MDHCSVCQGEWTERSPAGLCPACLMRLAMSEAGGPEDGESDPTEGPIPDASRPPWDATAIDEWDDQPTSIRLIGEIGRGSMGTVHRGRDDRLGRDVAVKLLREDHRRDPCLRRRFLAEARIAGQLQHPAIVPVYEFGRLEGDRPYIAMKLVEGQTLAELLRTRSDPLRDRGHFLAIVLQACQALAYAHSRHVVHRDLKPANIMVGPFGEVQVMDWGLAKVLDGGPSFDESNDGEDRANWGFGRPDQSRAGTVLGTPAYMAPEQAEGNLGRVDERSDVFGLGAILYETLTGRPPFPLASVGDDQKIPYKSDPIAPSSLRPGGPRDLEIICLKCLAKDPDGRYANASELADDLARFLEGRAIAARPVGPWGLSVRWCRRNLPLATAISVAVLLLMALAIGGTLSAIIQADLRHRAEVEAGRAGESEALAKRQRDLAQRQFSESIAALKDLSDGFDRIDLVHPDPARLLIMKQHLASTKMRSFEEYLRRSGENPASNQLRHWCMFNLGRLRSEFGPQDQSTYWYEQALKLGRKLEGDPRSSPDEALVIAQATLASALGLGGNLAVSGKLAAANDLWEASRQDARRYQNRFPKDFRLWETHYSILGNLSLGMKRSGRIKDAEEITRQREILLKAAPPR